MAKVTVSMLLPTNVEIEVDDDLMNRIQKLRNRINGMSWIDQQQTMTELDDELEKLKDELRADVRKKAEGMRDAGIVSEVQLLLSYSYSDYYCEL